MGKDVEPLALKIMIEEAINFDAPLVSFDAETHVLELWHGPTLAFKDFGARFMARLMKYFREGKDKELIILTATSGDTGSAVAHGFLGVPGIRVIILYPSGKVSDIQEKQLTTMGQNISALEIEGTFDDCQRLVKQTFTDQELRAKLDLSSANSINIARLIPQSFYYAWACAQIGKTDKPIIVSVPCGNFGNLTAGLIAKRMGIPITRFIAATNSNDIVPKYLLTGKFTPAASKKTISNAMDVGNPSNFVRMLELYDHSVENMRQDIVGYSFSDDATRMAIKEVYKRHGYILDPHGAVAYLGLEKYQKEYGKEYRGIFFATAHQAKFLDIVQPLINDPIPVPERLQEYMKREKRSIVLSSEFEQLKRYLLG